MRLISVAMAAALLSGPAQACGNPLLWAMLFARHPEARTVYDAELAARSAGVVRARDYVAQPGVPYHRWSLRSVTQLAEEMAPVVSASLPAGGTLTLLLADEVAALRFSGDADAPEVIATAKIGALAAFDAVTTVNVLYTGWRHALSYDAMLANDLVVASSSSAGATMAHLFDGSRDAQAQR